MPEKTKHEKENPERREEKSNEIFVEESENDKKGIWSEDQKGKSYYYDDSYGYEVYNPDEDDDDEDDSK